MGRGGTKQIAELAGLDPKTIRQGRIDLKRQLEDATSAATADEPSLWIGPIERDLMDGRWGKVRSLHNCMATASIHVTNWLVTFTLMACGCSSGLTRSS